MRLLKCYGDSCVENSIKYPKDKLFEYKGKNYCFEHLQEKQHEDEDRIKVYAMIKKYFKIPYPTTLMMLQIKKFQKENGYTLAGIAETIDYMASLPWVTLDSSKGLGLIPYVYDDAFNESIRRKDMQIKAEEDIVKSKTITVKEDKFTSNKLKTNNKKFDFGD